MRNLVVTFVDGLGAGRVHVEDCKDGVSAVVIDGQRYVAETPRTTLKELLLDEAFCVSNCVWEDHWIEHHQDCRWAAAQEGKE